MSLTVEGVHLGHAAFVKMKKQMAKAGMNLGDYDAWQRMMKDKKYELKMKTLWKQIKKTGGL